MRLSHATGFALCLLSVCTHAAVINGYAEVTAITTNTLTIGTTDETASSFVTGKAIILMQMQDDVIGSNTTNASTFGNISAIKNTGHYEVRTITSVTRTSGVLATVVLNAAPSGTYSIGTNSSVQAITYELLGSGGNYTLSTALAPLAWNGSIGGVVAFFVNGTLTLGNSISADGAGFRGGARTTAGGASCDAATYITATGAAAYATKGEGIYKLTNTAWTNARGKNVSGGGGGNSHNSGGGGGGGYSAGGDGGAGYSCGTPAGGIGGAALGSYVASDRVFLGGGGGGGEGNNNVSTDGARGGGIILIKANSIVTTGSCGTVRISANGSDAANASANDGGGAGGAGGSIVLQVPSYTVASGCNLVVRANGGSGGGVGDPAMHGGGGGGGQGTVIYSIAQPTTNITTQTVSGTGGCNNNSSPCTSAASSGALTSGSGIKASFTTVLPIELVSFTAVPMQRTVDVSWITASESNNALFSVERSVDAANWQMIGTLPGAINSSSTLSYDLVDDAPLAGTSYYRLVQTDLDGTETRSSIAVVERVGEGSTLFLFPNPATDHTTVVFSADNGGGTAVLLNDLGQEMSAPVLGVNGRAELDLSGLPNGAYTVLLRTERTVLTQRLLVKH